MEKKKIMKLTEFKCICGKTFTHKGLSGHYKYCNGSKDFIDSIKKNIYMNFALTDDGKKIITRYKNESLLVISNELNYCYGHIQEYLKFMDIDLKSFSESAKLDSVRNKFKKTCLEKYGGENVLSKGTPMYEKRNKTVKEKYGVDNVWQLDFVKHKIVDSLRKNGTFFGGSKRFTSNIEKIVEKYLISKNIKYKYQCFRELLTLHTKKEKYYIPDFILVDHKIIIEVQGDYWHANPNKYKPNDLIKRKELLAKEIWANDLKKRKFYESKGYKVLYIWEENIKDNSYISIIEEFLSV